MKRAVPTVPSERKSVRERPVIDHGLIAQAKRESDRAARNRPAFDEIVGKCLQRMMTISLGYAARGAAVGLSLAELHSAACEGLVNAVIGFRPSPGDDFVSYADRTAVNAIINAIWGQLPPRTLRRGRRKLEDARSAFAREYGRQPSDEELSAATGLTMKRIAFLRSSDLMVFGESFDAATPSREGEDGCSRHDTVGDERARDADSLIDDRALAEEYLSRLAPAERAILYLFFIEEMTHREIQDVLPSICSGNAMAYATVRSTQFKALAKIRRRTDAAVSA